MVRLDLYMPAIWVPGVGFHDIGLQMHSACCGITKAHCEAAGDCKVGHIFAVVFARIRLVSLGEVILHREEKSLVSAESVCVSGFLDFVKIKEGKIMI
jgi:hypothetical protein